MLPRATDLLLPLAGIAALALAGPAAALGVASPAEAPRAAPGIELTELAGVSDAGAARRISFYADRVMASLAELAADDKAAGETGAATGIATLARLRENMARFVDAAAAAGLDADATARLLEDLYVERYAGPPPVALLSPSGTLDGAGIVASFGRRLAAQSTATDYVSAISAAGARTKEERLARVLNAAPEPVGAPDPGPAPETFAAATPEPQPEAVAPDAVEPILAPVDAAAEDPAAAAPAADPEDPVSAAILARIETVGGVRRIRIAPGDTLARISNAIYGDSLLYRRIFEANRKVMVSPDALRVGIVLELPPRP